MPFSLVIVASSAVPPPPPEQRRRPPRNAQVDDARIAIKPASNEIELDRRRALLLFSALASAMTAGSSPRRASAFSTASTSSSTPALSPPPPPPPPPAGWTYSSRIKENWSSLGFDSCGTGQQSPINLSPPFTRIGGGGGSSSASSASSQQQQQGLFLELSADYRSADFDVVVERGLTASPKFTVVANGKGGKGKDQQQQRKHPAGGIYLSDGGGNENEKIFYPLVQFHFHRPGEEALRGKRGVLGAHLVHQRDDDSISSSSANPLLPRFVVVAVAFDLSHGESSPDSALADLLVEDEEIKEEGSPWRRIDSFDPSRLLPSSLMTPSTSSSSKPLRNFFAFEGSLTTPPCTKGARFYFAKGRKTATKEQIRMAVLPRGAENARPLQDRAKRVIWES